MTIVCPHCNQENRVAGWCGLSPDRLMRNEDPLVCCGFCGKYFAPEQGKAEKERAEPRSVVQANPQGA